MNKLQTDDTIAAIATPAGVGAISIIRVSGPRAIKAVDSIFSGKSKLIDSHTHTIHYGNIVDKKPIILMMFLFQYLNLQIHIQEKTA